MMHNYPDELLCDFAETYGIFNIKSVPARLAATLAVGLREDSRVKRKASSTKVSDNTVLLACIADCLQWIRWTMTEDAQKGINCPESILDYYLERKKPEPDYELFDSPDDFWEWANSITENN